MEELSGLNIMVTGGSGFLGSHLTDRLVLAGARVHAVSRVPRLSNDTVHWWQGSFEDIDSARNLIDAIHPDIIFHLGGHVTAAPGFEHVLPTLQSLLLSTVYLLIAGSERKCRRIVLTGSLTEPDGGIANEISGSPYAVAKWASNAYARMFNSLYQTPVVVVRPFMTYGPRQAKEKIVPYVISSLLRGEAPKLASGKWQADWIYVRDVIDGLLAAALKPRVEGSIVDLGSGTLVSVRDIVNHIIDLTHAHILPIFGALPDRPMEHARVADIIFAQRTLDWKPRVSLAEGLKETVDWYRHEMVKSPVTT
jgi:nucleoside-diphosphate-sugar epimerase